MAISGIDISPGGVRMGWIGNDPTGSGLNGAWFKKLWIGGASASVAPFIVDANGYLSISLNSSNAGSVPFQLNLNGVTTAICNLSTAIGYAGLKVTSNTDSSFAAVGPNLIYLANGTGQVYAIMTKAVTGSPRGVFSVVNPANGNTITLDADYGITVNGVAVTVP